MPAFPPIVPKAEEGVKVESALPEGAYAIKNRENETLSASPVTVRCCIKNSQVFDFQSRCQSSAKNTAPPKLTGCHPN